MSDKHYKYRAEVELVVEGELDARDHDEVKRKVEEDLRSQGFKDVKIRYINTKWDKDNDPPDPDDFDLDLQYPYP
jgi:divalent metal cation (Fe/Co/Zn/Cd) transporter